MILHVAPTLPIRRIRRSHPSALAAAATIAALIGGCAPGHAGGNPAATGASVGTAPTTAATASGAGTAATAAGLDAIRERGRIVPLVDHHQHLVGPTAVQRAIDPPAVIELPAELAELLDRRNAAMGTEEVAGLFAEDAWVLQIADGGDWWQQGLDAAAEMTRAYTSDTHFDPTAYALGAEAAWIAGVVRSGESSDVELNFTLGLRRGADEAWRIASEQSTLIPPRAFAEPITADDLIADLDEAGIGRAVVLSVAYWFDSGAPTDRANARAENDWTAAQVARHPDRLVAYCGIDPLWEWAVEEVRRCGGELGMRGVKMHFRSAGVDILDADHQQRVRAVFRAAHELGMGLVVHADQSGDYDRRHAEALLTRVLPVAPDVPVQIAHLWGGNAYRADVLAFWADAVESGDPRTRNLFFDLTEVDRGAPGVESRAEIARQLRRIGFERILYGSDAQTSPDDAPPALRWARLRQALPLTDDEWRVVAANVGATAPR